MAADNEEKERLVSTPKHEKLKQIVDEEFEDVMVEIKRAPHESGKGSSKNKNKSKQNKRTFSYLDNIPCKLRETIVNGSYDEQLNLKQGGGYFKACRQNGNWWSWLWIFVIFISLIFLIYGESADSEDNQYLLFIIPIVVGYFLYTLEWYFMSPTQEYLEHIESKDIMIEHLQKLYECEPNIEWNIQCFHYEQEVKVITHTETMRYNFNLWRDVSIPCKLDKYRLTEFKLFKEFHFADDQTKNDYDSKFNTFCQENKKDDYQHVDIVMKLENFTLKILVDAGKRKKSKYWSMKWYNICSCLFCSPCYRTEFNVRTGSKSHIIQKEITILPMFADQYADI